MFLKWQQALGYGVYVIYVTILFLCTLRLLSPPAVINSAATHFLAEDHCLCLQLFP